MSTNEAFRPACAAGSTRYLLAKLQGTPRHIEKHRSFSSHPEARDSVLILERGWVIESITLKSGSRQISRIYVPGDVIGFEAMFAAERRQTFTACNTVMLTEYDLHDVMKAESISEFLKVVASEMAEKCLDERVRLASIGRTSAIARVSALYANLAQRIGIEQIPGEISFEFHLSQLMIGDYTGLTGMHVNRVLQQLMKSQIIRRDRNVVTIRDMPTLRKLSEL